MACRGSTWATIENLSWVGALYACGRGHWLADLGIVTATMLLLAGVSITEELWRWMRASRATPACPDHALDKSGK